ncbi:hypothetical protein IKF15_01965 [Candidatus Saccharibacteria bacterium]|nr:hypothetical protein [Candidatus Saccharibacteria bacterium]
MVIYKRLKISEKEARYLEDNLEGYIWVAIDARRGSIAAGDDYVADLRDNLLVRRSQPEDIYGVGVDLKTGAIDYIPSINRRNPNLDGKGNVPFFLRRRIETLINYFFESFAPFRIDRASSVRRKVAARDSESFPTTPLG